LNYFAHYFFDHEPDNHYYNAGLVMPDFARVAEGAKHIDVKIGFDAEKQPHLYQLNRGSARHFQSDATFHNSAFFKHHTELLDGMFTQFEFPRQNQRIWFLSHILFEVLLDRVLITHHPKKLEDFYNSLQAVELEKVIEFLNHSGKDGTGRFSNFWASFNESQYMQYYVNDDSFLYSINRIITRAKQPELTDAQATALLKIVHHMEQELGSNIPALERELIAGRG
jgi:hypothetical protein